MPGYSTYFPDKFRPIFPFLLASLIHHKQWLLANLSSKHPLFVSPVWLQIIRNEGCYKDLDKKIQLGNTFNPTTNMTASGLPPHITQFYEFQNLKDSLKDLMTEHQIQSTAQISSITDRLQQLEERVSTVPDLVSKEIKKSFQIKGVAPITASDVENMFTSKVSMLQNTLSDKLDVFMTRYLSNVSISNSSDTAVVDVEVASSSDIPNSYRFPSLDVRNMWSAWFRGSLFKDSQLKVTYAIKPLYKCSAADFKQKSDKHMLSKCRRIVNHLLSGDSNVTHDQLANLTEGAQLYGTLDRLFRAKFGVGAVSTSLKVSTLYDTISKSQSTKRTYNKRKTIGDDSPRAPSPSPSPSPPPVASSKKSKRK